MKGKVAEYEGLLESNLGEARAVDILRNKIHIMLDRVAVEGVA